MADLKNPNVIDGFSSVQALRHAGKTSEKPRLRASQSTLPAKTKKSKASEKPSGTGATNLRIGQTAVPQKHNIVCYECAYTFVLTGKLSKTICPKCHKTLESSDHTIADKEVLITQTIGTVHILESGELAEKSKVVARNVVLEGNIEKATIDCTGTLELCRGAKLDIRRIDFNDVLVRKNCQLSLTRKLECRNLDVRGDIKGNIKTTGVATIRAGGLLRGKINTSHLVVEEGGGLKAAVKADG
ncbi:MAG: polymer-forming cytoskeletal protein [Kiritimatiellae bacterium]|nr:polymer-forming cytoskeletal protein [Kiritimatiellia bacterium]